MKKLVRRFMAFFIIVMFITIPLLNNTNAILAKDKHIRHTVPVISLKDKILDYSGENFTLSLSKTEDVYKITWYTQNERVAVVKADKDNKNATVTSVSKGTTNIRAKVTLINGMIYRLSCKVVVNSSSYRINDATTTTQAKLLNIVRTDDNILTATFDKGIEIPGLVLLSNKTICIEGVVDSKDNTKVNYTMTPEAKKLTGFQTIWIGYYSSPNVIVKSNTISKLTEYYVDFTRQVIQPLPAPLVILQDQNNNSFINIVFSQNLDKATAENISNYYITDVTILSAELINNQAGATVKLKVKEGSITSSNSYSIYISGVKAASNNYHVMEPYYGTIYLKENVAPSLIAYYYSYPRTIYLEFDEQITGSLTFKVLQKYSDLYSYSVVNGNTISVVLKSTPTSNVTLELIPIQTTSITDLSGNLTTSNLNKYVVPIY